MWACETRKGTMEIQAKNILDRGNSSHPNPEVELGLSCLRVGEMTVAVAWYMLGSMKSGGLRTQVTQAFGFFLSTFI